MFSISEHIGKTSFAYVERRTISLSEGRNKACFGFAERRISNRGACDSNSAIKLENN